VQDATIFDISPFRRHRQKWRNIIWALIMHAWPDWCDLREIATSADMPVSRAIYFLRILLNRDLIERRYLLKSRSGGRRAQYKVKDPAGLAWLLDNPLSWWRKQSKEF